jgi:hypothetical protein
VDDARFVRPLKAIGKAPLQGDDIDGGGEGGLEVFGKRRSVHIFHGQVGPADLGCDREHVVSHDRVMSEVKQNPGFLAEQLQNQLILGEFRKDDLDGERIAGLDVVALEHLAHAADADQRIDLVNAIELRTGRHAR